MNDKIEELCRQIEQAVNSVYVKGCDDVALSNMAQLRGIHNAVSQIRAEMNKKGEKDHA